MKKEKEPTIVYGSDYHLNLNLPKEKYERNVRKFAVYVAEDLNKRKADYFIINGDISYVLSDVDLFINTIKKFLKVDCKIYTTIGNHENSKHFTLKEFLYDKLSENYLPHEPIITPTKAIFGLNGYSDLSFLEKNFASKYNILETLNKRYFKKENDMTMEDFNKIIDIQLSELEKVMEKYKEEIKGKELILVTHYIPRIEFRDIATSVVTEFQNIFGGSVKTGKFIKEKKFDKCYFGHSHKRRYQENGNKPRELDGTLFYNSPLSPHYANVENGFISSDVEPSLEYLKDMYHETLLEI